jgi:hypothetical protein
MSRSIDLPEAVYAALEEAAAADATSPAEWIAARLPQPAPAIEPECEGKPPRTLADEFAGRVGFMSSSSEQPPRPLAERFEGHLGLVSLDRTDLAARASELFADGMEEKYRDGRL